MPRHAQVNNRRVHSDWVTLYQMLQQDPSIDRAVVWGVRALCGSEGICTKPLGILYMLQGRDWRLNGELWGDANAALGIINGNWLGKTRHISTGLLWIQQVAAEQRLKFGKVLGVDYPADLLCALCFVVVGCRQQNRRLSPTMSPTVVDNAAGTPFCIITTVVL